MASEVSKSTVYFDGSCPLCEAEVRHYRRTDRAGALCFVDISNTATVMPPEMARFHVRRSDGRVLSGAAVPRRSISTSAAADERRPR
jgi:predicted DCC family thiol-disulfide oxidoreductase YuxK